MDISRKTDYALRMLAMLAEDPERLLSVRTAAEEVNVPYSFARSIQHGLVPVSYTHLAPKGRHTNLLSAFL